MKDSKGNFKDLMNDKLFDVEHALGLYALSFYYLPAQNIYDSDLIQKLGDRVKDCHIYLIGIVPSLDLAGARQEGQTLFFDFLFKENAHEITFPLPPGMILKQDGDYWYLSDGSERRFGPTNEQLMRAFQMQHKSLEFNVIYIGQAYGKDGSRGAIDRLKRHETLQKIALRGAPEGYKLYVLLLEIQPSNRMITFFNPFAQDTSQGQQRIRDGIDKLFGTDEHERVTLYEASLIRYFQPLYNKEFKNSFPSTNLKVLADCYDKDFSSIIAEICFDDLPFRLCSDVVSPAGHHIIMHDLHDDGDRRVFFTET